MTLPVGTTLQHGNYVLDAWCFDDDIGPVYLATQITTGQWVQLRVLGSRHPEAIPAPAIRQQFCAYLQAVNQLNQAGIVKSLAGFEEDGVFYQVMACGPDRSLGYPLARQSGLSCHQALRLIQQVAEVLQALKPLGWVGLTLTPDQIWISRSQPWAITFTGFNFPQPPDLVVPESWTDPGFDQGSIPICPGELTESTLVMALNRLLYFALTGRPAETVQGALSADLQQQQPDIPPVFCQLLDYGSGQTPSSQPLSLTHWLGIMPPPESMPDRYLATQVRTEQVPIGANLTTTQPRPSPSAISTQVVPSRPVAVPVRPSSPSYRSHRSLYIGLGITALVASLGGMGMGFNLRMQPSDPETPKPLDPEQSFPPRSDWPSHAPIPSMDGSFHHRTLPSYDHVPPAPVVLPQTSAPVTPPPESANNKTTPSVDVPFVDGDRSPDRNFQFDSSNQVDHLIDPAPAIVPTGSPTGTQADGTGGSATGVSPIPSPRGGSTSGPAPVSSPLPRLATPAPAPLSPPPAPLAPPPALAPSTSTDEVLPPNAPTPNSAS